MFSLSAVIKGLSALLMAVGFLGGAGVHKILDFIPLAIAPPIAGIVIAIGIVGVMEEVAQERRKAAERDEATPRPPDQNAT